jgi:hypothetical protein
MKNRNLIYVFSIFILVHLFVETVWSQQTESVHIYNKQGDKILYKCRENVFHLGFSSDIPMKEREKLLMDLSKMADYYMLPDSSYCFTVDPGYDTQFKTKVYANSYVAYCQNEYRDSLGGVVWGTNRIFESGMVEYAQPAFFHYY